MDMGIYSVLKNKTSSREPLRVHLSLACYDSGVILVVWFWHQGHWTIRIFAADLAL